MSDINDKRNRIFDTSFNNKSSLIAKDDANMSFELIRIALLIYESIFPLKFPSDIKEMFIKLQVIRKSAILCYFGTLTHFNGKRRRLAPNAENDQQQRTTETLTAVETLTT